MEGQQPAPPASATPEELKKSTIDFVTLATPDWRCDRIVDDKSARLYCCPAADAGGWSGSCIESKNAVVFVGKESDLVPPAIKVEDSVKVKCAVERGAKTCYFPSTIPTKGEIARKIGAKKETIL
jgi:hypothetical protein